MADDDIKTKEIITIQKAQAMDVFTKRELIIPLLEKIEHVATQEVFDSSTDKGRKAIASMAYRVAQSKTYIESHGKDLAAELKELPKLVDSNRKYAKDFLDALRDRIRKPLDEWEAEQEAIKLLAKIENDHSEALLQNIEWELKRKAEQERIAKERADYESKVREDSEIKAMIKAQKDSRLELVEAEARALAAEKETQRQAAQAKIDIEHAQVRAEKQARDILEKEQRINREQEEIQRKSKLNQENIDIVHLSIINDFLGIGLNNDQAEYILDAVKSRKIKALRIEY